MADQYENALGVPGRRRIRRVGLDSETFGRFAEVFARFMGTARFLGYMTAFVVIWIVVNIVGLLVWDPYPFILLNLFFSTQASYAAPLILLAQNRQEARDKLHLAEDRRGAAQARAEMEFLAREIAAIRMNIGELATRDFIRGEIRNELRTLLAELENNEPNNQ
ncbi:MAG: hypothetical protein CR979_00035 [Propionibacterium sp.]|nr:MAG: hypothetical protein CR979_00035 [Propionibacterium sp.]